MKIKIYSFNSLLEKVSYTQLAIPGLISFLYLIYKEFPVCTGILISGLAASSYTQLIKLSSYSKFFSLMGFPARLFIIAPPCAILVHKLHSNLIALFIGFAVCQFIFILFFWLHAKELIRDKN